MQAIAALETLRAENETLAEEKACLAGENEVLTDRNGAQAERIRRLEHLNLELLRLLYGKRSEKLSADERQLAFEDLESAAAEIEAAAAPEDPTPAQSPKRPRPARNIGHLPEHLERIEQVIEPESTLCPCGCGEMVKIGEDRTERLDIVPAQLRVIVTIRPKYACRACEQGVTQAPAPARLIEGGLPTEGAIAHVLVSKYLDHCPLHRQAQVYARSGLDLDRSTLAGWVGRASFHLKPVADRLAAHLKRSSKLFMDETRAPVLDPGRGRTKTGWLWALARDDRAWSGPDPPGVVYFYAPGRGGEHAERFLDGFDGILQVDGYAGYNRLTGRTRKGGAPIRLAYCWSHARRRLREIYDSSGSEIAAEGLRRIAELYAIEADIRGSPPEQRLAERQARSAPLVEAFGEWLKQQRARISPKSRLGEKLAYVARHWDGLRLFLADGRVEMDSNAVENLARPIALTRKNALFAGHDEGAVAWGRIASLTQTARLNGIEPFAWLKATLEAIAAGHPNDRLDDLLPWNFKPPSS
ncbi:MAG: IS66 family transposase [Alphaproteobacteria bacterium]|nr:IS66 family transposase [Alphaproteobacteria bacterium]